MSAFFLQVCLTHLEHKVQYNVSFSVLNNRTHMYFPLSTFTCGIHWTRNFEHEANTVQQKVLSEEQSYSVICPCSKSISSEISRYLSLCRWEGFFSQSHLCFMAVSPSFCLCVYLHLFFFFLLHLGLHLPFCTSDFSLLIVLPKNGKFPVGKGSAWLISSSKVMEWVIPWPCCLPSSPKNQENKLDKLS